MPSQIYMPLRSNAAWFGDANAQARLERELKTNLVLYDYVLLQDGRVQIIAGNDGQGMEIPHWRSTYPGDRSKINYILPGSSFGVFANGVQVLSSMCEAGYEVDFFPLISEANFQDATFIRWVEYDAIEEIRSKIASQVATDLLNPELLSVLPANTFIRKQLLDGLYRDAVVAAGLKVPFTVDFHAIRVVEQQTARATTGWTKDLPQRLYQHWINLPLPDMAVLSWQELYDFRESDVGRSFREMVHRVTSQVQQVARDADSQSDVDHWLERAFEKELLRELAARVTTPAQTVLSMVSNFIPFGMLYGMAKDVASSDADQNSWVSLVRGYKPKPNHSFMDV